MGWWGPLAEGLGLTAQWAQAVPQIVVCPSEAWYEPAEVVGNVGQPDARMNMLAVQNTSVNGDEITPDDAKRVSVVNLIGIQDIVKKVL